MATHKAFARSLRSHLLAMKTPTRRNFATGLPFSLYHTHGALSLLAGFSVHSIIDNGISVWAALWESILRAVPKKKTSHSKKRSRFLAGKALKDVTSLNRCSGCGNVKRAHLLCPYCVKGILQPGPPAPRWLTKRIEIRDMWRKQTEKSEAAMKT